MAQECSLYMHGLQPWQKLEVYIVCLLGSDGEIFFFLQVEQKQEQAFGICSRMCVWESVINIKLLKQG